MKKILLTCCTLFLFTFTIKAQILWGIDISNVSNPNNQKWGWSTIIGTYTLELDGKIFDAVYKFPGKEFVFTTNDSRYDNMPLRYESAVSYLNENTGDFKGEFSNVYRYKADNLTYYEIEKEISIYGGRIETYWYIKSGNKNIKLTLTWNKDGISLRTIDLPLLSDKQINEEVSSYKFKMMLLYPIVGKEEEESVDEGLKKLEKYEQDKIDKENAENRRFNYEIEQSKATSKRILFLNNSIFGVVLESGKIKNQSGQKIEGVKVEFKNKTDKDIISYSGLLRLNYLIYGLEYTKQIPVQFSNLLRANDSTIYYFEIADSKKTKYYSHKKENALYGLKITSAENHIYERDSTGILLETDYDIKKICPESYQNEKYKVNYPKGWIKEIQSDNGVIFKFPKIEKDNAFASIDIMVIDLPKNFNFENTVNSYIKQIEAGFDANHKVERVKKTISNNEWTIFRIIESRFDGKNLAQSYYFIQKGNEIFKIVLSTNEKDRPYFGMPFLNTLRTFKIF